MQKPDAPAGSFGASLHDPGLVSKPGGITTQIYVYASPVQFNPGQPGQPPAQNLRMSVIMLYNKFRVIHMNPPSVYMRKYGKFQPFKPRQPGSRKGLPGKKGSPGVEAFFM